MRILGIDPGTIHMGFGVVEDQDEAISLVACGVVTPPRESSLAGRLSHIYQRLLAVIQRYQPAEVAIEEPFVAKNARSALAVGRAQAVAILAAAQRGLPVYTYSPTQVKLAVTGHGGSGKEQVQEMVMWHLGLSAPPHPADAADALAVALCHQSQSHLSRLLQSQAGARIGGGTP